MEELEKELSYDSGQTRFRGQTGTWDMRGRDPGKCLEQTGQSVHSNSLEEKLRSLDEKIQKSDDKLKKLSRRKGVVESKYIQIGQARIGLKDKPGHGRFYSAGSSRLIHSRTASRLENRAEDRTGTGTGVVRTRIRTAGQKDYEKKHSRQRRLENRAARKGRLLFRAAEASRDGSQEEDRLDVFPEAVRAGRKSGRLAYVGARRLTHRLLETGSVYKRYDVERQRNERLHAERRRLQTRMPQTGMTDAGGRENTGNKGQKGYMDRTGHAGSMEHSGNQDRKKYVETQKKRRKKQQVMEYREHRQESFSRRYMESRKKARKARERAGRTKRVLMALFSGTGMTVLIAGVVIILLYAILALVDSGTSIGISFISMNDYGVMTDCTAFFNDKCTGLYMYLNIDRDQKIEPDLEKELEKDIYEFKYDVASPITYDQIKLLAYLSAKYGSFKLDETVRKELDEIFDKMFEVEVEVKEEPREVTDEATGEKKTENKNICYVTLKVTGFDDVTAERLTDGQKNSYLGYQLSSCGQQVMNPVMEEDWTELISSPFGSRYHPIHKEYRMHNGVDIAVPTGTMVYAAVSGEVTAARYSDSAGYMVSVTDANGYTVTYMHLSSYSVAVGQKITAGQFVALSGNTGNSTGPHLHLAVQDADGNYLNPVFMIPQTCVKQ